MLVTKRTTLATNQASTLHAYWKKIWTSLFEIENMLESTKNGTGEILKLAKSIGFMDIAIEDVQDQWKKKLTKRI